MDEEKMLDNLEKTQRYCKLIKLCKNKCIDNNILLAKNLSEDNKNCLNFCFDQYFKLKKEFEIN